jgi:hypothetical protein
MTEGRSAHISDSKHALMPVTRSETEKALSRGDIPHAYCVIVIDGGEALSVGANGNYHPAMFCKAGRNLISGRSPHLYLSNRFKRIIPQCLVIQTTRAD